MLAVLEALLRPTLQLIFENKKQTNKEKYVVALVDFQYLLMSPSYLST